MVIMRIYSLIVYIKIIQNAVFDQWDFILIVFLIFYNTLKINLF